MPLLTFSIRFLIALTLAALAGPVFGNETALDHRERTLRDGQTLEQRALCRELDAQKVSRSIRAFYRARDCRPVWIELGQPTERAEKIIGALGQAELHGLKPADYLPSDSLSDYELELALSQSVITFVRDLRGGRVESFGPGEFPDAERIAERSLLDKLSRSAHPDKDLHGEAPANRYYRGLQDALENYRKIASTGGWPQLAADIRLERGDTHPEVVTLRKRLTATGDLRHMPSNALQAKSFDASLEDAVRHFQERHGLAIDGIVGPETGAALRVPVEARIDTIKLNLERLRWLPDNLGKRHVFVNVAAFRLYLVESGTHVFESEVIVGQSYQQTPMFSDHIEYIVANPYWNIPDSIARKEIVPKAAADPSYLAERNMEVLTGWSPDAQTLDSAKIDWQRFAKSGSFPYRIRQRPGPDNALGRLKVLFPNRFSVYLHDTPGQALFERRVRTFSHGCIRVKEIVGLADRLLSPEIGHEELEQIIASGKRTIIAMPSQIPIHITYLTAWQERSTVHFRRDVYSRDEALREALIDR